MVSSPESSRPGLLRQVAVVLEMIKFQHTIFALPFALASMLIAAHGLPSTRVVIWIVLAAVFARTAAMSFNRWADHELDRRNPRTATRAIPAGQLSPQFVLIFAIISIAAFVLSAAMLNRLTLWLSPVALLILLGYSYAKRFTAAAHFILGTALALAPVGAWVAVTGRIQLPAIFLGFAVLFWTAGFDLIYACQDAEIDRQEGLFSVPSRFGPRAALRISQGCHILSAALFVGAGMIAGLGLFYQAGALVASLLLLAEQLVVDPSDTRKINLAFFTINSWVGVAVLTGTILEIYLGR